MSTLAKQIAAGEDARRELARASSSSECVRIHGDHDWDAMEFKDASLNVSVCNRCGAVKRPA